LRDTSTLGRIEHLLVVPIERFYVKLADTGLGIRRRVASFQELADHRAIGRGDHLWLLVVT